MPVESLSKICSIFQNPLSQGFFVKITQYYYVLQYHQIVRRIPYGLIQSHVKRGSSARMCHFGKTWFTCTIHATAGDKLKLSLSLIRAT